MRFLLEMKGLTLLFILLILSTSCFGQIDEDLINLLDSLKKEDQKWRGAIRQLMNSEIDSISRPYASSQMKKVDSLNFLVLQDLFKEYGYPGYALVGKEASHNFWLLVQHQDKHPDFQEKVLTKMKVEAEEGNASYIDYAYLLDRVKVNTGQLQVYATQLILNSDSSSYEPKPVIDPENLNERRKEVGLSPIDWYIKIMNERYYGRLKSK